MLATQRTTTVWKLPLLFKLLNHLSSKLGFDGITDLMNDQGNSVRSNSEVVR